MRNLKKPAHISDETWGRWLAEDMGAPVNLPPLWLFAIGWTIFIGAFAVAIARRLLS